MNLLSFIQKEKAACLRLYPCPGPDLPYPNNPDLGEISSNAPYRVSLQAAIWDKEIFNDLLVEGENAWEMEIKGSLRSRSITSPFLSVKRDIATDLNINPAISYFCTAIDKGKWKREAIDFCKKEGIKIDSSKRPVQSWKDLFWRKIKSIYKDSA